MNTVYKFSTYLTRDLEAVKLTWLSGFMNFPSGRQGLYKRPFRLPKPVSLDSRLLRDYTVAVFICHIVLLHVSQH